MFSKQKMKKSISLIGGISILLINFIFILNSDIHAKRDSPTGFWGTHAGCEVGLVVGWTCYESVDNQCIAGETGSGYCPPH